MALKLHVAGLEEQPLVKLFIAGHQGAGKTLMSSTFPDPWFASCESRVLSLADRRTGYVEIKSSADMDELIRMLKQPPEIREKLFGRPVRTIVIDTVDGFQKVLKIQRTASSGGKFLRDDWGWLGDTMRSYMRSLIGLDMNVVVTSHLGEVRDDEIGRITYKPALEGSFANDIANHFDIVGVLNARPTSVVSGSGTEKVIQRQLQLFPDAQTPWLKDCTGKLPLEFPVNLQDDYQRMYGIIFSDWDERKAKADADLAKEAEAAIERAEEIAELLTDKVEMPEGEGSPGPVPELVKPKTVDTVSSDQFRELTAPFADIKAEAERVKLKDTFVKTFGNPTQIPADKFEEALDWVTLNVVQPVEPEPEPEVVGQTTAEVVESNEVESPQKKTEAEGTNCAECGAVIDDPDIVAFAELQGLPPLCRKDLREKNKK